MLFIKLHNNQKTENRLKVCPEKVDRKKYVTFPITNKTESLNQSIILQKKYLPLLTFEIP